MKNKVVLSLLLLILLLSRCTVLSFYPLYTLDRLRLDQRLEGKWESILSKGGTLSEKEISVWEISKVKGSSIHDDDEVKYTYRLKLYPKGEESKSATFQLHLVQIGKRLFFDFYPEDFECLNDFVFFNIMPVHTFARIEIRKEQLEVRWFNADWLAKLFEQNKIRMRHEKSKDLTLLTAKPQELQKFVEKYADEAQAFKDGMQVILKRH